ncbi:S-adenosyl-L-methionine-dependent methyltransferase [Gongronella butleri]|nr:S-adenosyl-L-methionine-dependent methyltransferase [Gongronella butleri]
MTDERPLRRQSWFGHLFSNQRPHLTHHRSASMLDTNLVERRPPQIQPKASGSTSPPENAAISPSTAPERKKKPTFAHILHKKTRRQPHVHPPKRAATIGAMPRPHKSDHDDAVSHHHERWLDRDGFEADKSQLKNEFLKLAFTDEFRSTVRFDKLPAGSMILDVGCGSGAWCIEKAQQFPHLQVIGIDFEEWFPEEHTIPRNCRLVQRNILDCLAEDFGSDMFDFIHIRCVSMDLTAAQYDKAIHYCWQLLKPNGTMELMEIDMSLCCAGPATTQMCAEFKSTARHHGFSIELAKRLASFIPQDDSLNLVERYSSLPLGIWGGRIGARGRDDILDLLQRAQSAIAIYYDKPIDALQLDTLMLQVTREMEMYHTFANVHFLTVNKRPARL